MTWQFWAGVAAVLVVEAVIIVVAWIWAKHDEQTQPSREDLGKY